MIKRDNYITEKLIGTKHDQIRMFLASFPVSNPPSFGKNKGIRLPKKMPITRKTE